jgi:hypothetical protein
MSEAETEQARAKAVAATTARLDALLHEMRKDEAKLKRFLEMRRITRRLQTATRGK